MKLHVEVTPKEALLVKFRKSLTLVKAYGQEAWGDQNVDQDYTAGAVHQRLDEVYKTLMADIEALASEIVVKGNNRGS